MFPQGTEFAGVAVQPRDEQQARPRNASQIPVTLFFIGVKLMRPHLREIQVEGEIEILGADGVKRTQTGLVPKTIVEAWTAPIINVRGRALQMPPIGHPVTVPKIVADELMVDGQWPDARNNVVYPGFTQSEVEARAVRKLWEDACERDMTTAQSCIDGTHYETAVATEHVANMSEEDLLAQLALRRGVDQDVLAQLLGEAEIDIPGDEGDSEPEKPKRGRPRKTES